MGADGALPVRKEERVERLALTEKKRKYIQCLAYQL